MNQHIADLFSSFLSFEKLTLVAEQSAKNKKLSFFENPFSICLLIYSDSNHSSSFSFKNLVRTLVASAWALPEFLGVNMIASGLTQWLTFQRWNGNACFNTVMILATGLGMRWKTEYLPPTCLCPVVASSHVHLRWTPWENCVPWVGDCTLWF